MKRYLKFSLFFLVLFAGYALLKIDLTPPPRSECVFCSNEFLKEQRVYQGDFASVVMTHKPITPGHLLIIPNRHANRFEEMTAEEIAEIGVLVKKVEALSSGEYLLLEKNGRGVGQTVPHVHVHLIPKPESMSQLRLIAEFFLRPMLKPLSKQELAREADRLRGLLGDSPNPKEQGVNQ